MRNKTRAMIQTLAFMAFAALLSFLIHLLFNLLTQSDILLALAGVVLLWWVWIVYKINLAYLTITDVLKEEQEKLTNE